MRRYYARAPPQPTLSEAACLSSQERMATTPPPQRPPQLSNYVSPAAEKALLAGSATAGPFPHVVRAVFVAAGAVALPYTSRRLLPLCVHSCDVEAPQYRTMRTHFLTRAACVSKRAQLAAICCIPASWCVSAPRACLYVLLHSSATCDCCALHC